MSKVVEILNNVKTMLCETHPDEMMLRGPILHTIWSANSHLPVINHLLEFETEGRKYEISIKDVTHEQV